MFAVVRISLGIWSFFVAAIAKASFHTLAWILTGFVAASALLGLLIAASNAGKSLDLARPNPAGVTKRVSGVESLPPALHRRPLSSARPLAF
jgi:hypothetical protein